ncbi:hypothetical protein D3C71_343990 [compost metagenome]
MTLKEKQKLAKKNKLKAISIFKSLKGNITLKELGDMLGVSGGTVSRYISPILNKK